MFCTKSPHSIMQSSWMSLNSSTLVTVLHEAEFPLLNCYHCQWELFKAALWLEFLWLHCWHCTRSTWVPLLLLCNLSDSHQWKYNRNALSLCSTFCSATSSCFMKAECSAIHSNSLQRWQWEEDCSPARQLQIVQCPQLHLWPELFAPKKHYSWDDGTSPRSLHPCKAQGSLWSFELMVFFVVGFLLVLFVLVLDWAVLLQYSLCFLPFAYTVYTVSGYISSTLFIFLSLLCFFYSGLTQNLIK